MAIYQLSDPAFRAALGMMQHMRAGKRKPNPPLPANTRYLSLHARLGWLIAPWTVNNYPGRHAIAAHVMGISVKTARAYARPGRGSPQALERAATWLRAKASEMLALADEMVQRGNSLRASTGNSLWASRGNSLRWLRGGTA